MNIPTIILSILGIAASAGVLAAYYKRAGGLETIKLLQINIDAYKDAEKLKDERIKYLEGQVYSKDQTIIKLSNGATK